MLRMHVVFVLLISTVIAPDQAFEKAWKEACSSSGAIFMVPKNKKYLVKQITFEGPCKAALTVQVTYKLYCL